jgi:hypothetical protein
MNDEGGGALCVSLAATPCGDEETKMREREKKGEKNRTHDWLLLVSQSHTEHVNPNHVTPCTRLQIEIRISTGVDGHCP